MGPRYDLTKRHFVTSVRRTCFPAKMPKKRVGHEMLCCLCCPYGRISASHTLYQLNPTMWTQDLSLPQPCAAPPQDRDCLKVLLHPLEILEFGGGRRAPLGGLEWRGWGSLAGPPLSGGQEQLGAGAAARLRRRRSISLRSVAL